MSYSHPHPSSFPSPVRKPDAVQRQAGDAVTAMIRRAEDAIRANCKIDEHHCRRRVDTEAAIAGTMIIDPEAVTVWRGKTASIPLDELFSSERVRMVVEGILDLEQRNIPPDYTLVNDWLQVRYPERGPWMPFLAGLDQFVFAPSGVRFHIDRLIDHWRRDRITLYGEEFRREADRAEDLNSLISAHSEKVKQLMRTESSTVTANREAAKQVLCRLLSDPDAPGSSIRWYWQEVQAAAGPLKRGSVAILAAPPGTGKTAAAQQQAEFCAQALGLNVLMVLMESDVDQIMTRHAMQRHGVDGRNINSREFTQRDLDGLFAAQESWEAMNDRLHLAFPGPISGDEIDALVLKWKLETGRSLDLLVVDHLHKMPSSLSKVPATDHHAVSHNFMRLSQLAAREQCAVLLCAQPPKESYSGDRRIPTLGDIKNSGTPIEGAKQIIHLHYTEKERLSGAVCRGKFCIVKANDGRCGMVRSLFIQPSTLHIEDTPHNRALYADLLRHYRFNGLPQEEGE